MARQRILLTFLVLLALPLLGGLGVSLVLAQSQTPPPALPPNHPPMGAPGGGGMGAPGGNITIPPPAGDAGTGNMALKWTPPSSWKKEKPSSGMRRAQYRIPGPGGDAECVVFYFGPGQGGDTKANVARWTEQFRKPDGKPASDSLKTREIKVGGIPVTMVEVAGTYVGGMGGTPAAGEHPNYMLLGAIADGPDAKWFFRATGPRATLEPQRAAFDTMIKSLKRGS
jgi:hypothetical protein